jgi:hypothetical protein
MSLVTPELSGFYQKCSGAIIKLRVRVQEEGQFLFSGTFLAIISRRVT